MRCVTPAVTEYEETGDTQIVLAIGMDGIERPIEKPVLRLVSREAKFVDDPYVQTVWIVDDGTDKHEFLKQSDAEIFSGISAE